MSDDRLGTIPASQAAPPVIVAGDDGRYTYVGEPPLPDVPFQVPPVPHHLVARWEIGQLRSRVLESAGPTQSVVIAVEGEEGVGKTALVAALCHDQRIVNIFSDGILWASLGPDTSVQAAQARWGMALGNDLHTIPTTEARAAYLRRTLHNRRVLLVIDDVRHPDDLIGLRVAGPDCVTVLTTPLIGRSEELGASPFPLEALSGSHGQALLTAWALTDQPPGSKLAMYDRSALADFAQRLGYLPLSLEIAGALSRIESIAQAATALAGAQGEPASDSLEMRRQALSHIVNLMLRALYAIEPEAVKLFPLLGVFGAGGGAPFDAEAVAAVWQGGADPADARRLLDVLCEHALLCREGQDYVLPTALSTLTRAMLDRNPQARTAIEHRHSAHYWRFIQSVGGRSDRVLRVIGQMRVAWARAQAEQDVAQVYAWADVQWPLFEQYGLWRDMADWSQVALAAARRAQDQAREALYLNRLGRTLEIEGRIVQAMETYRQSLSLHRAVGDQAGEARTLNSIAAIHQSRDETEQALDSYRQALELGRAIGDRSVLAVALNEMGFIFQQQREFNIALEHYRRALELYQAVGDQAGQAVVLERFGAIYQDRGELGQALDVYQRSLAICRAVEDRQREAQVLNAIGWIYNRRQAYQEALDAFQAGLALCRDLDDLTGQALALRYLGAIYEALEQPGSALEHYERSLSLYRELGDLDGQSVVLSSIGAIHYAQGNLENAYQFLRVGLEVDEERHDSRALSNKLYRLGELQKRRGEHRQALEYYRRSLEHLRDLDDQTGMAQTLNAIGYAYARNGQIEPALENLNRSLAIRRATGDRTGEAETLNNMGLAHDRLGEFEQALDYYRLSLDIRHALEDYRGEASTAHSMALAYRKQGNLPEAIRLLRRVVEIDETLNLPDLVQDRALLDELRRSTEQRR